MMRIIAMSIVILALGILKDTHVGVYYRCYGPAKLQEEYDVIVPLWMALIICEDCTHVFPLRGDNIVTRGLLKVKNLLCKKV